MDTGAMYRAIALAAKQREISLDDVHSICEMVGKVDLAIRRNGESQETLLDGKNVEHIIRTSEISMGASKVSAIPCVREAMVEMQREVGYESDGAILEGRDIGTVVFPDAPCKVYLVADVRTRAVRRQKQLAESGTSVELETLEREIAERDQNDMTREHSPLRKPDDAIEVETTNTTIDEQVSMILSLVKNRHKRYESECNERNN